MLTNAEIRFIRSLKEKKFRDESAMFVVEGEKMVAEALSSDYRVEKVYRLEDIGQKLMSRICSSSSVPPVLALVHIPKETTAALKPNLQPEKLYLALDSVRDPGNMGTIIRMADWFGVEAVFASSDSVEFYNPKVVQATMGSIFRVPCHRLDLIELCQDAACKGIGIYGTMLDGVNIYEHSLSKGGLIVMGNESAGVSTQVAALCTTRLRIPSFGRSGAESLNVAIATAICLSEFRRR